MATTRTSVSGEDAPSRVRPPAVRAERLVVAVLAVVSAVLALFASPHPTGVAVADALLRMAFAGGVVWLAAAARRWTWFVLAGGAGLLGSGVASTLAAVIALVVAFVAAFAPRRARILGGVVGLLSVQVLLHLPDRLPVLLTALGVIVSCAPCVWSGYRLHSRRDRRRIRIVAEMAVVFCLVFGVVFALDLLVARSSLDRGVDEARAGLVQVRLGNQKEAIRHLEAAAAAFRQGRGQLDAWWAKPAQVVPLVGIQSASVDRAAAQVDDLVRQVVRSAKAADYEALHTADGQIDLKLLASFQRPVQQLIDKLADTKTGLHETLSPWLLPPVRNEIDGFRDQVVSSTREAHSAMEVLRIAPKLLGADGPRRYALLFGTPAESRELGGFAGNFGELTAVDGKLKLERTVRSMDLAPATEEDAAQRRITLPIPTRYAYYQPARYPGNVTGTEDFPTVARTFNQLYPQTGGPPVDGVIYIDPYGLAALLRLTGPIPVEGLNQPLTADNAANFLLKEQYRIFQQFSDRVDYLEAASRATFEQLTSRKLPGPKVIADDLTPLIDQRRLLAYSFHPEDQRVLDRLGLGGAVPKVAGDSLSVTTANANPNKIDAYLDRSIGYEANVDPATGKVSATATVTLHNSSPSGGLPDYTISNEAGLPFGTNHTFLSVYSPLALQAVARDGQPVNAEPQVEYGRNRYGLFVDVPPGGTTTLTFQLAGTVPKSTTYRWTFLDQPAVNPDQVRFVVHLPPGVAAGTPHVDGPIGKPHVGANGPTATVDGPMAGGILTVAVPIGP